VVALLVATSLAVLLISNLWLLREVEVLRERLDVYQREVLALDAQLSRLTVQVQLLSHPHREAGGATDTGQSLS